MVLKVYGEKIGMLTNSVKYVINLHFTGGLSVSISAVTRKYLLRKVTVLKVYFLSFSTLNSSQTG